MQMFKSLNIPTNNMALRFGQVEKRLLPQRGQTSMESENKPKMHTSGQH